MSERHPNPPAPVSREDTYLAAILEELEGLPAALADALAARESPPAKKRARRTTGRA